MSFGYSPGQTLIADVSLRIDPGEAISIMSSSPGKSTLLRLAAGLLEPDSGAIRLGGVPLDELSSRTLARHIGYIPQQTTLFRGRLMDNLTMFETDRTSIERATRLSAELGLDAHVMRLAQGYDTPVDDEGAFLPRGVLQRMTIVRALIRSPRIILFDDANTAFDHEADLQLRRCSMAQAGRLRARPGESPPIAPRHGRSKLRVVERHSAGRADAVANERERRMSASALLRSRPAFELRDHVAGGVEEVLEASDFGACLVPLLAARGWSGARNGIAEALPHATSRMDLTDLRNTLSHLGLATKPLVCSLGRLDPRLLPCLFVTAQSIPLVVMGIGADGYLVFDGAKRRTRSAEPALRGTAYPVTSPAIPPKDGRTVLSLAHRFRRSISAVLGLTVLLNIIAVIIPMANMIVYDQVIGAGDERFLLHLCLGLAVLFAGEMVLRIGRVRLQSFAAAALSSFSGPGSCRTSLICRQDESKPPRPQARLPASRSWNNTGTSARDRSEKRWSSSRAFRSCSPPSPSWPARWS